MKKLILIISSLLLSCSLFSATPEEIVQEFQHQVDFAIETKDSDLFSSLIETKTHLLGECDHEYWENFYIRAIKTEDPDFFNNIFDTLAKQYYWIEFENAFVKSVQMQDIKLTELFILSGQRKASFLDQIYEQIILEDKNFPAETQQKYKILFKEHGALKDIL